jgi:hypothetical protein
MSDETITVESGVVCLKLAIDSDGKVMTLEIIDNTEKDSVASHLLSPYTAGTELYDGEYIDMDNTTYH